MTPLVVYWPRGLALPAADGAPLAGFQADASTVCVASALAPDDALEGVVGRFYRDRGVAIRALDHQSLKPSLVAIASGAEGPEVLLAHGGEMEVTRVKVVLYDAELAAAGAFAIERQRSRSPFVHAPELLDKIGEWHVKQQVRTPRAGGFAAHAGAAVAWCSYPLFAVLAVVATGFDAVVARLKAPSWTPLVHGKSLQDGSFFLALANRRIAAIATWPKRVRHYYRLGASRPLTSHEQLEMLALMDFVLMFALDVTIGYYVASFAPPWAIISDEQHPLGMLKSAPSDFLHLLRVNVSWLMGAPAGFKLNKPLATILGNGVMLWLDMWEFFFSSALSIITEAISSDAASIVPWGLLLQTSWATMGVTLQLSLVADAVGVCTWSSRWVYQYFAKLNRLQFALLSSLWKLFVGKKKNVLRKRVDSQEYDIGQLLLGTLLFTILVFIVTTTMVFFVFFLLVRTGILVCLAALKSPVVAIHTLPLATLAVRICHPLAFTVGMQLEPVRDAEQQESKCVEVTIGNAGVGFSCTDDKLHRRAIRNVVRALDDSPNIHSTKTSASSAGDINGCAYFELKPIPIGVGDLFSRLWNYFDKTTMSDPLSVLCDLPPLYWPYLGPSASPTKEE